jgi:hypothetical protein
METRLEGHDTELRSTRGLVVHRRLHLLLGEINIRTTTLLASLPHESSLEGELIGVTARLARKDLVAAFGSNT